MTDKEKLVQWMMKRGYATGHGDNIEYLLLELAWQMDERIKKAVEKEREEIAQLIEQAPTLVPFGQNEEGGCIFCGFTPKTAAVYIKGRGAKND